jgi:hypothetical protein
VLELESTLLSDVVHSVGFVTEVGLSGSTWGRCCDEVGAGCVESGLCRVVGRFLW